MKITIDTQHDRMEDIEKVIRLLSTIFQQKGSELKLNEAPVDSTNLMSMFDSSSNQNPASEPSLASLNIIPSKSPPLSSIPEAKPKVELY